MWTKSCFARSCIACAGRPRTACCSSSLRIERAVRRSRKSRKGGCCEWLIVGLPSASGSFERSQPPAPARALPMMRKYNMDRFAELIWRNCAIHDGNQLAKRDDGEHFAVIVRNFHAMIEVYRPSESDVLRNQAPRAADRFLLGLGEVGEFVSLVVEHVGVVEQVEAIARHDGRKPRAAWGSVEIFGRTASPESTGSNPAAAAKPRRTSLERGRPSVRGLLDQRASSRPLRLRRPASPCSRACARADRGSVCAGESTSASLRPSRRRRYRRSPVRASSSSAGSGGSRRPCPRSRGSW